MSLELIYTSAAKGLKPGSRGFCTVAMTAGLPPQLVDRLESLSAYRPIFPPQDPQANLNPVAHSHLRISLGGRNYHVLSRIFAAGLDYSQRANQFAHHVALDAGELPPAGPAWLLAAPGFMAASWDGVPKLLAPRRPPSGDVAPAVCRCWERLTGDAGWGGALAQAAIDKPRSIATIIFQPGQDPLPLLAESLALLPRELRWSATFSTYFTKLPPGVECRWRCAAQGSPEAIAANGLIIDLCRRLGKAPDSVYTTAARTGRPPLVKAPKVPAAAAVAPDDADLAQLLEEPELEPILLAPKESRSPAELPIALQPLPPLLPSSTAAERAIPAPRTFRRKESAKWPYITAAAALAMILAAGGAILCMSSRGDHGAELAHAGQSANESSNQKPPGKQPSATVAQPSKSEKPETPAPAPSPPSPTPGAGNGAAPAPAPGAPGADAGGAHHAGSGGGTGARPNHGSGAGDSNAAPSNPANPPAHSEAPKPMVIPPAVRLPHSSSDAPTEVATIPAGVGFTPSLLPGAGGEAWFTIGDLKRDVPSRGASSWEVLRQKRVLGNELSSTPVGTLWQAADGKLRFAWSSSAPAGEDGGQLRNCVLTLGFASARPPAHVVLREPVLLAPIEVGPLISEHGKDECKPQTITAADWPDCRDVFISATLAAKGASLRTSKAVASPPVEFPDLGDVRLQLVTTVESKSEMHVALKYAGIEKHDPRFPRDKSLKELLPRQFPKHLAVNPTVGEASDYYMWVQDQLGEESKPIDNKEPKRFWDRLPKGSSDRTKLKGWLTTESGYAESLKTVLESLKNAEVRYRIYTKAGDQEVGLVVAEPPQPEKTDSSGAPVKPK